jgi:hypothetical protein
MLTKSEEWKFYLIERGKNEKFVIFCEVTQLPAT